MRSDRATAGVDVPVGVEQAPTSARIPRNRWNHWRWVWEQNPRAVMLAVGMLVAGLGTVLFAPSTGFVDIVFLIFLWATLASAWNFLAGFGGQLSLGHATFYGVGAYAPSLLFLRFDISPILGSMVGGLLSVLLAVVVGLASLRLKGVFFAMATFVMGVAFMVLAVNAAGITGGSFGLPLPVRGEWYELIFASRTPYLVIAMALFAVSIAVIFGLRYSRFGLNLVAARSDLDAARSFGIDVRGVRLRATMLSAFITSVCGTLSTFYLLFIDPVNAFGFALSVQIVIVTIIGGIGTLGGPLIGAMVVIPLEQYLRDNVASTMRGLNGLALGVLFLLMVMLAPNGLWGFIDHLLTGARRRATVVKARVAGTRGSR